MERLEISRLRVKSYHGGSGADFAARYRFLQFDRFPQLMAKSESKNSIQVIERLTRLPDALANSPAPAVRRY